MKKSIFRSALLAVLGITLGIVLLGLIGKLGFSLFLECVFDIDTTAKKLDNPYYESNYKGWQTIYVEDFGALKIPCEWTVIQSENMYVIRNADSLIGYMALVGTKDAKYASTSEFYADVAGFPFENISQGRMDQVIIESWSVSTCTFSGEVEDCTYYRISAMLGYIERSETFEIMILKEAYSEEKIIDVYEAIAVSYYKLSN